MLLACSATTRSSAAVGSIAWTATPTAGPVRQAGGFDVDGVLTRQHHLQDKGDEIKSFTPRTAPQSSGCWRTDSRWR